MARCSNCGLKTERTSDWACPSCGYPLVSRDFREMPQTYRELREERLDQPMVVETKAPEAAPPPVEEAVVEAPEAAPPPEEAVVETPTGEVIGVRETDAEPPKSALAEAEAALEREMERVSTEMALEAEAEKREAAAGVETEQLPAFGEEKPAGEETAVSSEPVLLTVEELHKACGRGGGRADAIFTNKVLRITGTVGRMIVAGAEDGPGLILTSGNRRRKRNVLCQFDPAEAASLEGLAEGDEVTVQGRYDSCEINILVVDCVVVA